MSVPDREVEDALARSFLSGLPPEVVARLREEGEVADYPAGTELAKPAPELRGFHGAEILERGQVPGVGRRRELAALQPGRCAAGAAAWPGGAARPRPDRRPAAAG